MMVRFVDGDYKQNGLPRWAAFLIRIGFRLATAGDENQKFVFVSMPQDSGGAGLVALGMMLGRLGIRDANDLEAHVERIREHARRGNCRLYIPGERVSYRGPWVTGNECIRDNGIWVRLEEDLEKDREKDQKKGRKTSRLIVNGQEWRWRLDDHPLVASEKDEIDIGLFGELQRLLGLEADEEKERVWRENARLSDRRVVLAAHVRGRPHTIERLNGVRIDGKGLAELLGLHQEKAYRKKAGHKKKECETKQRTDPVLNSVRRVFFYKPEKANAAGQEPLYEEPLLVTCDGIRSFLRVRGNQRFENASVACVYSRQENGEWIERLGDEIGRLRHFRGRVVENPLHGQQEAPAGIGYLELERAR